MAIFSTFQKKYNIKQLQTKLSSCCCSSCSSTITPVVKKVIQFLTHMERPDFDGPKSISGFPVELVEEVSDNALRSLFSKRDTGLATLKDGAFMGLNLQYKVDSSIDLEGTLSVQIRLVSREVKWNQNAELSGME